MRYWLGEYSWPEVGELIDKVDFLILPTGSFEQHGRHLPLLTDSIRAENLCLEIAKEAEKEGLKVLLLPTLVYGVSEHHMRFPGTISVEAETYISLIESIGASLARHGFKRLAIINFHGGNRAPLQIAIARLRAKHGLKTYLIHWTEQAREYILEILKPVEPWGHACEHETSMVMLYRPDLVRSEEMVKPKLKDRPKTQIFLYFDERTDTGGLGDPTRSSREKAEEIVRKATAKIVNLLKELIEWEEKANIK